MGMLIEELTPDEVETITRLRAVLAEAKYPSMFRVSVRDLDIVNDYFRKIQARNIAEWEDAGRPDDWPNPLWIRYCGPHMGLMFKGVELLPEEPVSA